MEGESSQVDVDETTLHALNNVTINDARRRTSSSENYAEPHLRMPVGEVYYEGDFGNDQKYLDPAFSNKVGMDEYSGDFNNQNMWQMNDQGIGYEDHNAVLNGGGFGLANPGNNYSDYDYSAGSPTLNTPRSTSRHPLVTNGCAITPQTRHARRIYVGNIPTGYLDEDALRTFLNSVICKGLGDESDTSYILSIYVNQQKCFAFVELNSIELTTAALDLDGILYRNSPLKILRANEYKPELLPSPAFPPIKLNLSGLMFGNSSSNSQSQLGAGGASQNLDPQLDHIVKYCSVNTVQKGSIVIVGFPYEDTSRRSTGVASTTPASTTNASTSAQGAKTTKGCALAPRIVRTALRKFQSGAVFNPEYGVDISQLKIVDIGDVQAGMTLQEAYMSLSEVVTEIIQRGGLPVIIGGPSDLSMYSAQGLMTLTANPIAYINISPNLDARLMENAQFFMQRGSLNSKLSCEGRFVQFAAQGSASTAESMRVIQERGGRIYWLNRDIRGVGGLLGEVNAKQEDAGSMFRRVLQSVGIDYNGAMNMQDVSGNTSLMVRPVCVALDMSSISSASFPGQNQCRSQGLHSDEVLAMSMAAGMDPNVVMLTLTEFNPEVEENRSSRLIIDMIYNFAVGVTFRAMKSTIPSANTKVTQGQSQLRVPNLPSSNSNISIPLKSPAPMMSGSAHNIVINNSGKVFPPANSGAANTPSAMWAAAGGNGAPVMRSASSGSMSLGNGPISPQDSVMFGGRMGMSNYGNLAGSNTMKQQQQQQQQQLKKMSQKFGGMEDGYGRYDFDSQSSMNLDNAYASLLVNHPIGAAAYVGGNPNQFNRPQTSSFSSMSSDGQTNDTTTHQ